MSMIGRKTGTLRLTMSLGGMKHRCHRGERCLRTCRFSSKGASCPAVDGRIGKVRGVKQCHEGECWPANLSKEHNDQETT